MAAPVIAARSASRRHPAFLTFLLLWLGAAMVVALQQGLGRLVFPMAFAVVCIPLGWWTLRLTPGPVAEPTRGGARLWLQVGALGAVIAVTLLYTLIFHNLVALGAVGDAVRALVRQGPATLGINPLLMVALPLVLLRLLGAQPRELGLAPGRRPWAVGLLWSAPYLLWVLVQFVLTGTPGPEALVWRAVNSLLQNGFSEEFLWRGALQSLLEQTLGSQWSLVIASLLFGVWHVGANLGMYEGSLLGALAHGVAVQGLMGLAFGFVFQRTRSLTAPTLFHIATHLPG